MYDQFKLPWYLLTLSPQSNKMFSLGYALTPFLMQVQKMANDTGLDFSDQIISLENKYQQVYSDKGPFPLYFYISSVLHFHDLKEATPSVIFFCSLPILFIFHHSDCRL